MMNETLKLNDGTVLNGHALESGSDLFLYVYGSSLAELYPLVSDAEKTVEIEIGPKSMRTLGRDYVWRVEPGEFRVWLSENSAEDRQEAVFTVK